MRNDSDPKLAAAMCRAYNRWLADYCKPYPDRLFGVAMLPMQSVNLAIEEMRFARKQLGMKGGFLRPNPYNGRMANHPDYDPFWAEAQELDFSIGFHEGASGGIPTVGAALACWETFCDRIVRAHPTFPRADDNKDAMIRSDFPMPKPRKEPRFRAHFWAIDVSEKAGRSH